MYPLQTILSFHQRHRLSIPDYEKHGILCYLEHSLCGLASWMTTSSKVLRWQFTEDLLIISKKMSILSQLSIRAFGHRWPRSMQAVLIIPLPRASILIAWIRKCYGQDGESQMAFREFVWWYSHIRQLLWTQAWCFKQQRVTLWDTTFILMAERSCTHLETLTIVCCKTADDLRSARRPLFFIRGNCMTIPLYLKSY